MKHNNTRGRASAQASFTLVGSLLLLTPPAVAADALTTDSSEDLDTVQVTANRIPQLQNDVLASTDVITRDEIDRLQANSLVDLLQSRNGIEVARSGPMGSQTSLFMRGTESDHTLILVNGQILQRKPLRSIRHCAT